ncbi:potassium-transporting ATPase subunit A, partial [mine drainage metagenome]
MITPSDVFVILVTSGSVLLIALFFSKYLLAVFSNKKTRLDRIFGPIETTIYRISGVNPYEEMGWKSYLKALLYLNVIEAIIGFLILMFQGSLPLNPMHFPDVSWSLSFNTALSFSSNTNLQHYNGGSTLSYLSQMASIQFLQFTSAATGLCVAVAVFRGIIGKTNGLGNFYVDYTRSIVRILIPLSGIAALILVFLGVPQSLNGYALLNTLQTGATEVVKVGPIASLDAIMQLGTNGGGYFGANGANPLANPSPITNLFLLALMMLLPTSVLFLFGRMAGSMKEGRTLILASYSLYFIDIAVALIPATQIAAGMDVRFGSASSVIWTVTSTAFTTGSMNANLSAFNPLVILAAMFGMIIQATPGGIGVGAMYMLMYVIMAVFIVGLMAGRTPEYLGTKINASDVRLAVIAFLSHPIIILVPTVITFAIGAQTAAGLGTGSISFTQVFYEFTSAAANNGSDFLGSSGNTVFFNVSTGIVMWLGRFVPIAIMLAISGNMVQRKRYASEALRTDSLTFAAVLVVAIFILAVLTFFPFLTLG